MGNRGHVFNHVDLESGGLQGADRGLTAGAGSFDEHLDNLQSVLHRRASSGFSSGLRRVGSGFPGTAEAQLAGAGPGQSIALGVGDGDNGCLLYTSPSPRD